MRGNALLGAIKRRQVGAPVADLTPRLPEGPKANNHLLLLRIIKARRWRDARDLAPLVLEAFFEVDVSESQSSLLVRLEGAFVVVVVVAGASEAATSSLDRARRLWEGGGRETRELEPSSCWLPLCNMGSQARGGCGAREL